MTSRSFTGELKRRHELLLQELRDLYAQLADVERRIDERQHLLGSLEAVLAAASGTAVQGGELRLVQEPNWRRLTVQEAIRKLLAEEGRPMHADEIRRELEQRGKRFSPKDPKATVVTALIRGVRRGDYIKTGPNTFRLAMRAEDETTP
jgi:hypothetical protein